MQVKESNTQQVNCAQVKTL